MRSFTLVLAALISVGLAAPTTTVKATTTFTKSLSCSTPEPTHWRCNVRGHFKKPAVLVEGHAANLNLCADACESMPKCLSFSYLNKACVLYSKNLVDQTVVSSAPKATLYERHCLSCPKATATSTTTTSSTTSSTSTPLAVCTPSPTNVVVNPSFEATEADGSSPPWMTTGLVTFVDDNQNAYDGSYYADMIIDTDGGSASISQSLPGLDTSLYYIFNSTFNIVQYGAGSSGNCVLDMKINGEEGTQTQIYQFSATGSYVTFRGTFQPPSSAVDFVISFTCGDNFDGTPAPPSEVYLDSISVATPDLTCAMYVQVVPSGTTVDGQYLYNAYPGDESYIAFIADKSSATQYTVDNFGNMMAITPGYPLGFWEQDTRAAATDNGVEDVQIYDLTDINSHINSEGFSIVQCAVEPITFLLDCSNYGDTVLADDSDDAFLALGTLADECCFTYTLVTLHISYVTYNAGTLPGGK